MTSTLPILSGRASAGQWTHSHYSPNPRQRKRSITGPRENDANVRAAETKLRRQLGTQVHIVQNTQSVGGKIEIEFYSDKDLDRLYSLLMRGTEATTAA